MFLSTSARVLAPEHPATPPDPANSLAAVARDAVVYTLPLFEMARSRATTCPRRDDSGQFAGETPDSTLCWVNRLMRDRQLLGPQHRKVVTPNNDTLYISGWLDVGEAPLLISVPDTGDRYYVLGLLDFYTNPFSSIGTRTTGNGAGKFLLHYRDMPLPADIDLTEITPIACPTRDVWMIGRVLVEGPQDLQAVHALQDRFLLTTLDGGTAARRFDVGMDRRETVGDARRYAEVVNAALLRNPPPATERAYLSKFAAVGIGIGDSSKPAARDDEAFAALGAALEQVIAELDVPHPSALGGGWFLPVEVRDSFGDDYFARAHVCWNYIGALGIEEAMYFSADCDSEGRPLDGRYTYELAFPSGGLPQAKAFWSLTMYDKASCMLVDNVIDRYSVGDRSQQLRYSGTGLTLRLSAQSPQDETLQCNWLPAPAAPFYVTLRVYIPGAAHLEHRYTWPPIRRID
ncbi:DUF1254 domain-containing protein [Paraburkholderia saeva]|uniref:DUF1254 domain-containing protein n=1 Tax=Paraburkholderia saeva TaxID=2777537 RepID=A0A9N8RYA9_9BURK|nr:DUF1254 domain-containing protein [Paraburkholderia saeva]CAG4890309.1 hypothetical protein R70241_01013 [Paraburkholderia saeva]CAG4898479.1 hypothetical protein R52603_02464 [Paraburkholderia saeva]CAG4911449.1 hypothetical protein LMG31841_04066 [Paraburkholderia saeva]